MYAIVDSVIQFCSEYGIDIVDLFEKNIVAFLGFIAVMSGIIAYVVCNLVNHILRAACEYFGGIMGAMSGIIGSLIGTINGIIGALIGGIIGIIQTSIVTGIGAVANSNQSFGRHVICGAIAIRILTPLVTTILVIFHRVPMMIALAAISYIMAAVLMKCSDELARLFWTRRVGSGANYNVEDLKKILKTSGSQTVKYWTVVGTYFRLVTEHILGRGDFARAASDDRKAESSKPVVLEQQTPGLLPG